MVRPAEAELEERLGIRLPPTLSRLVSLAFELRPDRPEEAFAPLSLMLDWIGEAPSVDARSCIEPIPGMTPEGVVVFARTGLDLGHFAFVVDQGAHPEGWPIAYVDKEGATVVAASLVDFLSLVAWGGALVCGDPDLPRKDGAGTFEANCREAAQIEDRGGEQRKGRPELHAFREASHRLRTLPGVVLPDDPGAILERAPRLELVVSDVPEPLESDRMPQPPTLDDDVPRYVRSVIEVGRLDLALPYVDKPLEMPAWEREVHWMIMQALVESGRSIEAVRVAPRIVARWEAFSFTHEAEWRRLTTWLRALAPGSPALARAEAARAKAAEDSW